MAAVQTRYEGRTLGVYRVLGYQMYPGIGVNVYTIMLHIPLLAVSRLSDIKFVNLPWPSVWVHGVGFLLFYTGKFWCEIFRAKILGL